MVHDYPNGGQSRNRNTFCDGRMTVRSVPVMPDAPSVIAGRGQAVQGACVGRVRVDAHGSRRDRQDAVMKEMAAADTSVGLTRTGRGESHGGGGKAKCKHPSSS